MNEVFYGHFYGLNSAPFHITPDPTLLLATNTHKQALAAVEYGIAAGKGFIVVAGEVGVGKTTVLRHFLDRLDPQTAKIIYLFNPALSTDSLYAAILQGLDITPDKHADAEETLRTLQLALLDMHEKGVEVVLAVDEAQNMPEATLESLRVLSNLETAKDKLLQIVLVGQPELETILAKHSLRQLAQRVAVRARILPLTWSESCRYIQHRLIRCGRPIEPPLFTVLALWYLAWVSRGVPRTLNICCDNALINGYGHGAERISLRIVREAIRPLQLPGHLGPRFRRWVYAAALFIVLGGLVATSRQWEQRFPRYFGASWPAQIVAIAPLEPPPPPSPIEATAADAVKGPIESAAQIATPTPAASAAEPISTAAAPPPEPIIATPPRAERVPPDPRHFAKPPPSSPVIAQTPATQSDPMTDGALTAPQTNTEKTWLVQRGDTVLKICRMIYGSCSWTMLKSVLVINPNIGSNAEIHPGEVLRLPDGPELSNRKQH
jgi:general secretion pathway protein A